MPRFLLMKNSVSSEGQGVDRMVTVEQRQTLVADDRIQQNRQSEEKSGRNRQLQCAREPVDQGNQRIDQQTVQEENRFRGRKNSERKRHHVGHQRIPVTARHEIVDQRTVGFPDELQIIGCILSPVMVKQI